MPLFCKCLLVKPAILEWTTMTIEGKAKKGATYLEFADATNKQKYKTLIKFAEKEGKPVSAQLSFFLLSFLSVIK